MVRRRSNQRITKIKKDFILELLKKAEGISVEDGTAIQPPGSDLIPYPDMDNLRLWTRDYLLKGLTKTYPVKIDDNGVTYQTTLIDGLPLFTKLTKSISYGESIPAGPSEFVEVVGNPTIGNTGIIGNFSASNYLKIPASYFTVGDTVQLKFTTGSDISTQDIMIPNPLAGNLSLSIYNGALMEWTNSDNTIIPSGTFKANTTYWVRLTRNTSSTFTAAYSTTGANFTSVSGTDAITVDCEYLQIGVRINGSSFFKGTIDLTESYFEKDGVKSYLWNSGSEIQTIETSKPGLWLSNLCAPISNSNAGSLLRQNQIHDNLSSFNSVNSDIIGNYSYSFLQRGLIFEGELSDNTNSSGLIAQEGGDSFCLHWSPSVLGSTAIPSLSIGNSNLNDAFRFGNTYTHYLTQAYPSNPDMQVYDESLSKYVEFQSIKNSNELSETTYAMRAVGTDWTYELKFTPNHSGSGCNYGQSSSCSDTTVNGSNGGCLTGTITYVDSVTGTTCTQEVNSCYQTSQSYFNPNVPEIPNSNPITPKSTGTQTSTNCCIHSPRSGPDETLCGSDNPLPYCTDSGVVISWALCGVFDCANTYQLIWSNSGDVSGTPYAMSACGKMTKDLSITTVSGQNVGTKYTGIQGGSGKTTVIFYYGNQIDKPQDGVNLYLNIIDLKKQYENQGIPWTGGCGTSRFTYSIDTYACTDTACTSKIIAEDVDINELGDISNLQEVTLTRG